MESAKFAYVDGYEQEHTKFSSRDSKRNADLCVMATQDAKAEHVEAISVGSGGKCLHNLNQS